MRNFGACFFRSRGHVVRPQVYIGAHNVHQHITNWVKTCCVAKAPHFCGEFLSRQHSLPTQSDGNVAIALKHYFTEWLLLWMCMCGWTGGQRGRTHLFLLFLSLSAPSWEMSISELPGVYTTTCIFILRRLRRKKHLSSLLSSHCFQAHPVL